MAAMRQNGIVWNRFQPILLSPLRCGMRSHLPTRSCRTGPYPRGPSNPWSTLAALPHRGHPEIFRDSFSGKFSGGGGPSKVCGFLGEQPHGVPRADFFWRGQTFDYFLEIKDFKRGSARRPGRSRVCSMACCQRPPDIGIQPRLRREYFSDAVEGRGGISKFCPIARTTAWQHRADICEFPETFFGRRGVRKNAAKFTPGGWVGAR
jgi:hypothetical protein